MTMTTAEREAKRCWVLIYSDGESVDLDGEVHYATEESAAKDAPRYANDDAGAPVPQQLTEDCVIIACSCCDTVFDAEGEGVEHHPSVESARSVAVSCGWTLAEGGTQKCEDCSEGCDCEAEAASAEGETR